MSVQWVFNLIDRVSAPAKTVSTALDKVTESSQKASETFVAAEKSIGKGRDALGRFTAGANAASKSVNVLGMGTIQLGDTDTALASVGNGILEISKYASIAGVAIAGLTTAFGAGVLRAQAFKETTLTSLRLILKDGKAAGEVWADAVNLARETPLDTQGVVDGMRKLLAIGMNKDEARFSLQAMGDVASLNESPEQALSQMTLALGQIKAAGKLNMQDLRQITNWSASAGVGITQVYETLAKSMGKTTSDIPKLMEQGLVSGEAGVFAILKTFQDKVSGGLAGSVMQSQSKTLGGLWSNLKSAPFDFFAAIDSGGGIASLKDALFNVTQVLNPSTEAGQKLLALLTDLTNEIFGVFKAFAGADGQQKFSEWLMTAVDGVRAFIVEVKTGFVAGMAIFQEMTGESSQGGGDFVTVMRQLGEVVGVCVTALGFLAGMFKQVFDGFNLIVNGIDWSYLREQMVAGAKFLLEGLISTLIPGGRMAFDALSDIGNEAIKGFKGALGIQSPSKVFEELGRYTVEGFNVGVDSEAMATKSIGFGQAPDVSVATTSNRQGFGPVHVNVSLAVDARGSDGATLAKKLAELLPGELVAAFEAMAIEGGVA